MLEHPGPFKDTKPELEMKRRLAEFNITYEHQKYVKGVGCVDFYLPGRNQIIEVDGCWYHGCLDCHPNGGLKPDGWLARQKRLVELGYDAVRIWEHELT
jgi:G:T-mismatch repair DNA endonuclease (very short patch repair protein)